MEPSLPQAPPAEPQTQAVYDKVYARVVNVDPSDPVVQANRERFEAVGDQPTYMLAPDEQGQMRPMTVPAAQAQAARDAGWQFMPEQQAAREVAVGYHLRQYDDAKRVALEDFSSNVLFGVPEVLENARLTPEAREARAIARERHAVASGVGTVAGALTGGVLSGGLGALGGGGARSAGAAAGHAAAEAAAPGLASRVLGAAGRGAAEGALWSTPQAVAQLSVGDYEKAAESILWGLGTGGALGLAGGGLAEASRAAKARASEFAGGLAAKVEAAPPVNLGEVLTEHSAILDKSIASGGKKASGLTVKGADLAQTIQGTLLATRPGLAGSARTAAEHEMRAAAGDVVKAIGHGDKRLTFGELDGLRKTFAAEAGETGRGAIMRQAEQLVAAEQQRAMASAYGALPLKADYARYLSTLEQAAQPSVVDKAAQWVGSKAAEVTTDRLASWAGDKLKTAATNVIAGATGGALGAAIGGPIGAFVGQRAVNPLINKVLGGAIERHGTDLAGKVLDKIARDPRVESWFGASIAKHFANTGADRMRDGVAKLSSGAASKVVKARSADDVIAGYLGKSSTGLSRQQQWARVTQAAQATQANPGQHAAEVAALGEVFGHDAQLAAAVARKQAVAGAYVATVIAKQLAGPQGLPFRSPPTPGELTAEQKAPIARAIEVVDNPWSVMDHIQAGTLTKDHREAHQAVYPEHHAQLVAEVHALAANPDVAAKVPLGVRQQLEKFTGVPLTNPRGINYQASYRGPQAQGQGHGQKGVPKPRPARRPAIEYPGLGTNTSRIEHKEH